MATPAGRRSLLTLHRLAEAYAQRPSAIVGLTDEWDAFQLDAAALALGRAVEKALHDNATGKKEHRRPAADIVNDILGFRAARKQVAPQPQRTLRPGDPEYGKWAKLFGIQVKDAND